MKKIYDFINGRIVLRYMISGGTAAFTDLALLYFFTDVLEIWYITSAVLAFIAAFFVSFILQKFWTFKDARRDVIHKQITLYFFLNVWNLVLNTALIYFLVDTFGLWYILAQIFVGAIIAVESFLFYRFFVFKKEILT